MSEIKIWRSKIWHQRNTKDCKKIVWTIINNKMDNLYEMAKFLETYNLPKWNQEESENLSRQITPNEIEAVIIIKKNPSK